MKKLLTAVAVCLAITASAQDEGDVPRNEITSAQYKTAVGAKVSSGIAFSYKKFVTNTNAAEGMVMYFNKGVRLIGLYEFHFYNIEGLNGLAWYVGPGVHVGVWFPKFKEENGGPVDLGIDGAFGLDYKIPNTRFNVSLDWQPGFSILGNAGIQPQFGGLGIRYVID